LIDFFAQAVQASLVELGRVIYVRCMYSFFGREISLHTVIYGVYIRCWPTLLTCCLECSCLQALMEKLLQALTEKLMHSPFWMRGTPPLPLHTHEHTHTHMCTYTNTPKCTYSVCSPPHGPGQSPPDAQPSDVYSPPYTTSGEPSAAGNMMCLSCQLYAKE
jgi:hypothetical protein